ncbi:MAG: ABC transporter substrate-binding protein [Marmoricola sp.]
MITWVNPPAVAAFKKINAEFHKKYPGITVKLSTAEDVNGPYATLLRTSVSSGSADIVMSNAQMQPFPLKPTQQNMNSEQYWATKGVFQPLNGQPFLDNLAPASKAALTYKGKVQGLLTGHYDWIVFYNKAIFKKYNLQPPRTYSQFLKVCQKLKSHGVTPIWMGSGGAPQYVGDFLTVPLMAEQWLPNVPGKNLALALENGQTKWTDPHFTEAMNREKKVASYLEPNYTGEQWQGMPTAFAGGKSAMLLDGSWDLASIHKANPKMQVGSFPFPGSDNASENQPIYANDLWIAVLKHAVSSNPKAKDATMKWLNFFASKPIYSQYVNMTGISASIPGKYTGFSAGVLGKYFTGGINLTSVMPTLGTNQGYWDQETNWPTAQINFLSGKSSASKVQQDYANNWKQ